VEKTVSITYSEFASLALVQWLATGMRHIVLPLRLYNAFPLYVINGMIFFKKKQHKICVLIFSTNFV